MHLSNASRLSATTFLAVAMSALSLAGVHEADEPRVQTLVPGMTMTRLPVTLTNIDSVD